MVLMESSVLTVDGRQNECMVQIGDSKVVFHLDTKSRRRGRLVLKTVMPAHFKHNVFKRAKTHMLGKIEL